MAIKVGGSTVIDDSKNFTVGGTLSDNSSVGTSGQVLQSTGTGVRWGTPSGSIAGGLASQIPYQSAAGTTAFVANGTVGQVLTSNGTAAPTWAAGSSNVTGNALFEHSQAITANYAIAAGNNAVSTGPLTVNAGVAVTVPTNSRWVVL